jgi:hypothetical protein
MGRPAPARADVFDDGEFLDDASGVGIEDKDKSAFAREAVGRDEIVVEKEKAAVRHRVLRFPNDAAVAEIERDDAIAAFRKLGRVAIEAYGQPGGGSRANKRADFTLSPLACDVQDSMNVTRPEVRFLARSSLLTHEARGDGLALRALLRCGPPFSEAAPSHCLE